MIDLGWGYKRLPETVQTAWGARWIITQDGGVDHVWDRAGACGPDDRARNFLLGHLTEKVKDSPQERLAAMLRSDELSTREDREVVLYEDDVVVVLGSPQASAGYFYVSAYLRSEAPDPGFDPGIHGGLQPRERRHLRASGGDGK